MTKWNDGLFPPGMSQSDHDREFGGDPDADVCEDCRTEISPSGECDCPPEDDYYAYSPGDTPTEQTS